MDVPAAYNVREYVSSKFQQVREAGGDQVNVPCCFCNEPEGKRGRLYIDTNPSTEPPGLLFCHLCGKKGALRTLLKHFGDPIPKDNKEDDRQYAKHAVLQAAASYYHELLGDNEEILKWLKYERGLTLETLVAHQIGWADGTLKKEMLNSGHRFEDLQETGLVDKNGRDFFYAHVTIPYHAAGNVSLIRGKDIKGKYLTPPGQQARLFNSDVSFREKETLIITEGEFDCLILEQLGYSTVGCPGATSWQESWNSYFDDTRKVFVVFDNDGPGQAGAEKVARAIGSKARIVKMPEAAPGQPKNDPSEWIVNQNHTRDDFQHLLVKSRSGHLLSVYDAYAEWESVQHANGLELGFEQLDSKLRPGLLPAQLMIVLAKTGAGKGHHVDEVIPTPSGNRRFGDLVVGDEVFGSQGHPVKVAGVYDRGVLPMFRVTFSDGASVLCDGEHLWTVGYRYGRYRDWHEKTLNTLELLDQGLRHGKEYKFTIPMTKPMVYPERDLPIDPYTLGALLANGSLSGTSAVLTTPDIEVAERAAQRYNLNLRKVYPTRTCPTYTVLDLIGKVKSLGLGVGSPEKFIPEIYLRASVQQRIDLLHGLMDGDGSSRAKAGRRSTYYFSSSERLLNDITELITSLGGTASQSWLTRPGKRPEGKLSIMLPEQINAFSTSRKPNSSGGRYKTVPRRAIVSIEPEDMAECRCIRVDAVDSLYLIGRYNIVTHNTLWLLNLFHRMCMKNPDVRILFVSLEQTRGDWFERAYRIHRFYNYLDVYDDDKKYHQSCLEYFGKNLMMMDKNRVSEMELVECIEQYEYETGEKPDVVAVDYLGYWARAYKGEPYERTSAAVMALKAIAKEHRLAIVAPHQVSRTAKFGEEFEADASRDSGVVEETADFILTLWSPDSMKGKKLEERSGVVKLRIAKSRHGGTGAEVNLQFGPLSLAMVPHSDVAMTALAKAEWGWVNESYTIEEAIEMHRTGLKIKPDPNRR